MSQVFLSCTYSFRLAHPMTYNCESNRKLRVLNAALRAPRAGRIRKECFPMPRFVYGMYEFFSFSFLCFFFVSEISCATRANWFRQDIPIFSGCSCSRVYGFPVRPRWNTVKGLRPRWLLLLKRVSNVERVVPELGPEIGMEIANKFRHYVERAGVVGFR